MQAGTIRVSIFLQFYIDVMASHKWCRGSGIEMGITPRSVCPRDIERGGMWARKQLGGPCWDARGAGG